MVSLFIHLLLAASNRPTNWKGQKLERGQVIFGREKWAAKTGISEQSLRTCIKRLKSTGEITIKSTKRYSIITIENYNEYQAKKEGNQPANQPPTNQQSTNNQPHREKVRRKEEKKTKHRAQGHMVIEGLADFLQ